MLSLLLARQGIEVTLLESHRDFDREFRGDTFHSSSLEILEQIGLAERVLEHTHSRIQKLQFKTARGLLTLGDFSRLKSPYPYVAIIPQDKFLSLLVEEARRYPNFHIHMGATAEDLIEEDGVIRGVRYRSEGSHLQMRSILTVGADGRGSRIRRKSGLELKKNAPPMDVVWFRLPRREDDSLESSVTARFGSGTMLVLIDRRDYWQGGYIILKGGHRDLRKSGLEAFRQSLTKLAPEFDDRIASIRDWKDTAVLAVETGRVSQWFRPGLLLIGDAAHIMSPIGGVGINYAIQDAVATANLLTEPLRNGHVDEKHLLAVQRRRERATQFIQTIQAFIQNRIIANALKSDKPFQPPLLVRLFSKLPILNGMFARLLAYGLRHEHVQHVHPLI